MVTQVTDDSFPGKKRPPPSTAFKKGERKPWQFKPGQSGNPGGQPKEYRQAREAAKAMVGKVMEKLEALLDSADEKIVLSTAKEILDRAIGRPLSEQAVEAAESAELANLSDEELLELALGKNH